MAKDRFAVFSDSELYLLYRHSVESAPSIVNNGNSLYTKEEQQLHAILTSELNTSLINRARKNAAGTRIVKGKK